MSIPMHLSPLTVKKVSLICVSAMRGDGSRENPERLVMFYYDDGGKMMACYDPINGEPDSFMSPNREEAKHLANMLAKIDLDVSDTEIEIIINHADGKSEKHRLPKSKTGNTESDEEEAKNYIKTHYGDIPIEFVNIVCELHHNQGLEEKYCEVCREENKKKSYHVVTLRLEPGLLSLIRGIQIELERLNNWRKLQDGLTNHGQNIPKGSNTGL